jgi:hypothetical protein
MLAFIEFEIWSQLFDQSQSSSLTSMLVTSCKLQLEVKVEVEDRSLAKI